MHKYFMECLGTFYLLLILSLTVGPIAAGLMIMAMTCVGALVSGAHFNGAISLSFFLDKKLSLHTFLGYFLAQTVGALGALAIFYAITGIPYAPEPVIDMPLWLSMGIEALLTASFCMVALSMASSAMPGYTPAVRGFAIGLSFIAIASIGGLFNPSIALAIFVIDIVKQGDFASFNNGITYLAGPMLGSAFAYFTHHYFHHHTNNHHMKK